MEKFIFNIARDLNLDTNHLLPESLIFQRAISLNPRQKEELMEAITQVVRDGYFEESSRGLILTKKGRDFLY